MILVAALATALLLLQVVMVVAALVDMTLTWRAFISVTKINSEEPREFSDYFWYFQLINIWCSDLSATQPWTLPKIFVKFAEFLGGFEFWKHVFGSRCNLLLQSSSNNRLQRWIFRWNTKKTPEGRLYGHQKKVEWNCKTQLLIFLKEINILDISEYEQPYSEMEPIFHINFKSFWALGCCYLCFINGGFILYWLLLNFVSKTSAKTKRILGSSDI